MARIRCFLSLLQKLVLPVRRSIRVVRLVAVFAPESQRIYSVPVPIPRMCTAQFWKSPSCHHVWVELKTPCGEGKNISNCRSFEDGRARHPAGLKCKWAEHDSCPKCDKENDYDGSKIRMVSSITPGLKWGMGPSRSNVGIDCHCTVM